jgi:VIT1/CCC1 family predicted Fe2+/Mn2+ transporter
VAAAAGVGGVVARFAERPLIGGIARQVAIVLVACGVTYMIGELAGVTVG